MELIFGFDYLQFSDVFRMYKNITVGNRLRFALNAYMQTPKNGQTHSNNCLSLFDYFWGLVLKGLIKDPCRNMCRGKVGGLKMRRILTVAKVLILHLKWIFSNIGRVMSTNQNRK